MNPATLTVHAIGSSSINFYVVDATANSVHVMLENGEPNIIELRFDD